MNATYKQKSSTAYMLDKHETAGQKIPRFAQVFDVLHHTQQVIEHKHLLALVQITRRNKRLQHFRHIQRCLESFLDVSEQQWQICGLQYFHVLPGVAEDRAQSFLKLVAFRRKVDL